MSFFPGLTDNDQAGACKALVCVTGARGSVPPPPATAFRVARVMVAIVALLLPDASWSAELEGHVVRIVDGDTLVLLVEAADGQKTQEKIRLAGIDCPERKQAWGERARQALSGYVFSRDVTVEWTKRDRYKRIVGKVLDGQQDVDLALVRDGMCWWYHKYANEQSPVDRTLYEAAEAKARAAKIGLWSDPSPTPPWEWRHR